MLTTEMSNITYVSCLISSTTDPMGPLKRISLLNALLELDIQLILFVDSDYKKLLPVLSERTKVIELNFSSLETVKRIESVPNIQLPKYRNTGKDTLEFLTIMNSKPELLHLAKPYVETPYVAYLDAGIKKVFKDDKTLRQLETLRVHSIPLVLLPGCHPIQSVNMFPTLSEYINWTFCGGFFIVPTRRATEFMQYHLETLNEFLVHSSITWEVNVWTALAPKYIDSILWFQADHNDTMITAIPRENKHVAPPSTSS